MNEVTRIHLGRQSFTISVDAHQALKTYIKGIATQVHDKEVVEEVELRMAELLTERDITAEQVVLDKDVDYLKQQLGEPEDFEENSEDVRAHLPTDGASKRLFRDPQNGMVAGVAAGLAAYLGVDVLLIRILFIIATLTGGWGLLIYIVLWLLVPPATTGSDQLQMHGEPVTVGKLKEVVSRADAKGAAKRAGTTVAPVINSVFHFVLKLAGLLLIIGSLCILFGLVAINVYMSAHHGQLFQENLFPVGATEHFLVYLVFGLIGLLALFGIICGLAMHKRRWPVRGWVTGVIVGVFFIGLATAGALSIDAGHKVRDRYLSHTHTTTRSLEPFQEVTIVGKDVDYNWEYADTYSVSFHYFDNPDISKIKTTVNNNLLEIDTSNYDRDRHCSMLCIFPAYDLLVIVKGPRPLSSDLPSQTSTPEMPAFPQTE